MASFWRPIEGGKVVCTKHDKVFRPGPEVCPSCGLDEAQEFSDQLAEPIDDGIREGLPNCLEHEAWLVKLSNDMLRLAKKLRGPTLVAARIKAVDAAIKARRAALELARRREDWAMTQRLERAIIEARGGVH